MSKLVELLEEEIQQYINSKPEKELSYDYGYINGLRRAKEIAAEQTLALDASQLISSHSATANEQWGATFNPYSAKRK